MYPSAHRVYHPTKYRALDETAVTLQQILRREGFVTYGYFTHKRLMPYFGFAKGFDSHINKQCDKEHNMATADNVTAKALDILNFHTDDDLFLMLHYFDSHQPLSPLSPYADMYDKNYAKVPEENVRKRIIKDPNFCFGERDRENLLARYDAEIQKTDLRIGAIIDYLKKQGQYDDALIIISSDHGMVLGEHGSMKSLNLFDENLRVPMLIKLPSHPKALQDLAIEEVFAEASIDLMPTILDIQGINIPKQCQGRSLLPNIKDPACSGKGFVLSESIFKDIYSVSVRNNRHRYIYTTKFDITDFNNFTDAAATERFFTVDNREHEKEIGSDLPDRSEYRKIIKSHIDNSLSTK